MTGKSTHFRTQSPPPCLSASAPAKIPKPAVPWIRINPPHQSPASPPQISLGVILPLHPFKYQTAPLDMRTRSAEHPHGTKATLLYKPNRRRSKTKPFQNTTVRLRCAPPGIIPYNHMSPGNPFKSSFLCHSYEPLEWPPFHQVAILGLPFYQVIVLTSCHLKGSSWTGVILRWCHFGMFTYRVCSLTSFWFDIVLESFPLEWYGIVPSGILWTVSFGMVPWCPFGCWNVGGVDRGVHGLFMSVW